MKNVPNTIYLQIGWDTDESEDFQELEVSWCSDQINENDIRYVRADAILEKLQSTILFLNAHPSNQPDSEMGDRVSDLADIYLTLTK